MYGDRGGSSTAPTTGAALIAVARLDEARIEMHNVLTLDPDNADAKRALSMIDAALGPKRWWQFWNRRDELNNAMSKIRRYIGCSRVTRRPVMVFLSTKICPSDLIQVFAFDDDYSFGILQSSAHFEWFGKSSRLKAAS